ncbi:MAG: dihydrolipoyl dehydrogenase [Lentisphaeraceae bacterium]|nr:dihydrolipoyl dehydrogenase [Lentisphaeraceae bacterium]
MSEFDLIVIGAGPGGYVAGIRAAQLGLNVAVVEKYNSLGGTCLNVGCIPSKALLDSSELYHLATEKFKVHGIKTGKVSIDFPQMLQRKDDVISNTVAGIDYLFKKNNITRLTGLASFVDKNTISIKDENGKATKYKATNFIIATGSKPTELPFMKYDGDKIISSTHALKLPKIPKHLIIVGGGVIGLELGSVYGRLGSKVTVIEFLDKILPTMDTELGKTLQRSLKKINFEFHLSTKVKGAVVKGNQVTVTAENKKGEDIVFSGDHVLVSVGRKPFTEGLNLEKAGIKVDERGFILVNDQLQTAADNIYAIGDVIGGMMLAHKAEEEGVYAVEHLSEEIPHLNYNTIPGVVYTWPEVASVGQTEQQLKEAGKEYKIGKFPFKASGRARAAEETEGFVKVLADKETDEILGVHMLGPRCSDMIAEAVIAMEYKASAEDIATIVHAHPTFTEAFKEASLMATANRAIHV